MPEWLRRHLPDGWGGTEFAIATVALTVTTFVLSIIAVGFVVVRIPPTYFVGDHPPRVWADRHPFIRLPLIVGKNLLGALLIALGLVMSLPGVPGQGILTILIGAMLVDFPGKRRFERWLLRRRGVLSGVNKLRARYGRPPLQLDAPAVPT
jgi:hypothetical protein